MRSSPTLPPLVLRADATPACGLGHLMRCLALGQAWQEHGGQATLITQCTSDAVRRQVRGSGLALVPLSATCSHSDDLATTRLTLEDARNAPRPADAGQPWLIVDGYHFDTGYLGDLRGAASRMAMFTDDGRTPFADLDVLLNQNLGAEQCVYRTSPHTTRLLGTQYIAIRREFLAWRGLRRDTPPIARRLLVTLGGSDPANVTPMVIQALHCISSADLEVRVVVGPANPHLRQIRQRTDEAGAIELVTDPTRMPEQLAWADLAITAAGSTCWEMCCLALPQCVIAVNDTQAAVAQALDRAGGAVYLGRAADLNAAAIARAIDPLLADAARRAQVGARGQALVDGDGADRVVRALLSVSAPGLAVDRLLESSARRRERRHAAA